MDTAVEGFSLSPQQLHALRQAENAPGPYHVACRVRLNGGVTRDALAAALATLVAQEEILRTSVERLAAGSGVPVQVVHAPCAVALVGHDLSDLAVEERVQRLEALLDELGATPFAPDAVPALRAAFVRAGDEAHLLLAQPAWSADGASLTALVARLAAIVGGDGERDSEAPQYADLAAWLRDVFESEDAPTGLGVWRRVDLSVARDTRVALERPARPDEPGAFRPAALPVPLAPATRAALAALATAEGVRPGSLVLAAWQLALGRWAGRDDLVLGVATSGRTYEGLEAALGPFQKLVPIAAALAGGETLRVLARRWEAARAEGEEWSEYFELERAPAERPELLPHAFVELEAAPPLSAGTATFTIERRRVPCERVHQVLVLHGAQEPEQLELELVFDRTRLEEAEAAVVVDALAALLADAVLRSDAPVGELSMLSALQRERIVEDFARSEPLPAFEGTLPERIEAVAEARPDALAVTAGDGSLTYGELERRSATLARELIRCGVAPGTFVGVHTSRSVDLVVAVLGVQRAGAAYLPLPPDYPAERLAFLLEDARAPVVVTRGADRHALPSTDAVVVEVDRLEPSDAEAPLPRLAAHDPAYVIHTSGSTGRPKGVAISHANLAASTAARLAYYADAPTAYLVPSSFAFDSSVPGLFWTLATGGTVVLPEEGDEKDVVRLAELVREGAVTHVLTLPSLWAALIESVDPAELASLTTVIVAGESASTELVETHRQLLPHARLYDEYGPTEATVWATVFDATEPFEQARVPIGRPIPGAEAYVLDAAGEPCAIGVAGELFVGGPGVAAGYLRRPRLTAERFVPHPFDADGGLLYRTGDRARFLADGTLEFLGRVDHQVKVRGYRIELEEIEAVLNEHPAVREGVVHALTDAAGNARLVAWVTAAEEIGPTQLIEHLARTLPPHMLPGQFAFLEELPRLPNGKVDRSRLPAPEEGARRGAQYAAPETALETVLAGLWGDVLGVERIGVHDDFFELGGHSILATRLFARIVDTLQVRIPLRTLFDRRTIAELADAMRGDEQERARLERTAELVLEVLAEVDAEAESPSPS